jgi:4-diphosphocytidyl-2-C-methyl-D-erythritol kinase
MIFLSPAKVNLGLKITGKDPADGYHYIRSVFDPVSLYDIIDVECVSGAGIELIDYFNRLKIPPEKNLVYKAAALMKKEYGIKSGIKITLYKFIPHGAGLGGGSSNAATVIKALNLIFNAGLSEKNMAGLGFKLGSDVPFFIYSRAAFVTGKGNKIRPFKEFSGYWYVIAVPGDIRVPTAAAYDWYDYEKNLTKEVSYTKLINRFTDNLPADLNNDFERPVFKKYARLKKLKEYLLENGCINASLSGSGSAVYGIFKVRRGALECCEGMRSAWRGSFISLAHSI